MQIPEVSDKDIAFPGRWRELLPEWDMLDDSEKRMHGPYCDAVSKMFFNGGRLRDYGIKVRKGFNEADVCRYIKATIGDWGPRHEHKIGGIAHMLKHWCEINTH